MKTVPVAGLGFVAGVIVGAGMIFRLGNAKLRKYKDLNCKNNTILGLYNKWMYIRQEGKTVADYLKKYGYRSAAIYGMHYLGENLLDELKVGGIEVKYAIDRNADQMYMELSLLKPEDDLPEVDAIIVTAFYFFDEIRDSLQQHVNCPILSIEDIIYDML